MLMPSIFGESLLDDFFDDFATPYKRTRMSAPSTTIMKTDIRETDKEFELDIELPGYDKSDVSAHLKDGYMVVSAEKKQENDKKDSKGHFIRRERYYGSCSRSFYVGEHISEDDINAKFENGILKLIVPKKEAIPKTEERKLITIS